jgi:uncharacterized protein involved in type VI secretion and phage assembly
MSLFDMLQPGQQSGQERINGVMVAIVSNNEDPEQMARVKVSYPWRGSSDESHWARIAVLSAGKDRGMYFLPEVGDEVLVAFEGGDINHPYVIGSLWNGKDKPPEKNDGGKNDKRVIKSRSGHQIIMDDKDGKEKLTLKSKGGQMIVLDDSSGKEKIEIIDHSGSNSIQIDSAKNQLTITSGMKLLIKANMINIEADSAMTLKAGATLTIQGALVKIN